MRKRTTTTLALLSAVGLTIAMTPVTAGAAQPDSVTNSSSPALVAPARPSVNASPAGVDVVHAYPSAGSTIVGSVGFIDGVQVGYFWSASRGDSVTQTFTGPNRVKRAVLRLDVVSNALNSGAFLSWAVSINGIDVGGFSVTEGQLGPVKHAFTFPKITGGTYVVKMRATNEVAAGQGSHTWRYAGTGDHSVTLKRR